jgi:hypothetical protein
MSLKESRKIFKEIINICYNEDYPELHRELISIENLVKKKKGECKFEDAIQEVFDSIDLFAPDFPQNTFLELENIYQEYLNDKDYE